MSAHPARMYAALVADVRRVIDDSPVTKAELARRAGISRSTLARRLTGQAQPFYLHELGAIGEALGVSIGDLYRRAEAVTE